MSASLPRRPFLGVELHATTSISDAISATAGLSVVRVLADSMAAAAGMRAGDELMAVGERQLLSLADIHAALREAAGCALLRLVFRREDRILTREQPRIPLPFETIDGCELCYDDVQAAGARLRTIVTRPQAAGPHAAVLLLQGISLASVDAWHDPSAPLCQLAHHWARAGLVTMRLEKRGVGDSEGAPATEADFETELSGCRAALAALSRLPFVDHEAVFLFGHSVGGMIAPLLAERARPRGVMVYGSSTWSWRRCMLASLERQLRLSGLPNEETAAKMGLYDQLYQALFVEGLSPTRALAQNPALQHCDDQLYGRSIEYLRQLDGCDLASAWSRIGSEVLVMLGGADWIVGRAEQREIVERVQTSRSGSATLCHIEGVDHLFQSHASELASFRNYGGGAFDARIAEESLRWMRARLG